MFWLFIKVKYRFDFLFLMKATLLLLFSLTIIAFAVVFIFVKPIAQPLAYHNFIDVQTIFGIHNFYNVVSNISFIVVGIYGFFVAKKYHINTAFIYVLCSGFILTGIGSAYYHLNPNNDTLLWDRLPMTIVFTTFFAQVYSWYINKIVAQKIWIISLFMGVLSVWYWHYTETLNKGDLRLYALVQYLPMLLMLIIVLLHYKKHKALLKSFIGVAFFYFLAKTFENFDEQILQFTNIIGGHPLKHIAAAIATFYIVDLVKNKAL